MINTWPSVDDFSYKKLKKKSFWKDRQERFSCCESWTEKGCMHPVGQREIQTQKLENAEKLEKRQIQTCAKRCQNTKMVAKC